MKQSDARALQEPRDGRRDPRAGQSRENAWGMRPLKGGGPRAFIISHLAHNGFSWVNIFTSTSKQRVRRVADY